ncbi:MAG: hypothetical protein KGR47_04310 [Acidobacteria bacterium]|nr:hypothetical protein [Acidobacteriota bacterium]
MTAPDTVNAVVRLVESFGQRANELHHYRTAGDPYRLRTLYADAMHLGRLLGLTDDEQRELCIALAAVVREHVAGQVAA